MWIIKLSNGVVKGYESKTTNITVSFPFFYANGWFDIMLKTTQRTQQSLSNQYKGNLVNSNGIVQSMMIYNLSYNSDCEVDLHFLYFKQEEKEKEFPHLKVLVHGSYLPYSQTTVIYIWQKVIVFSPKHLLYTIKLWGRSNQITVVNMNKNISGYVYYYSGYSKKVSLIALGLSHYEKTTYTKHGYAISRYVRPWTYHRLTNQGYESWIQASRNLKEVLYPLSGAEKNKTTLSTFLLQSFHHLSGHWEICFYLLDSKENR